MPKSGAERTRIWRERKRAREGTKNVPKKKKSRLERVRECRARKKALSNLSSADKSQFVNVLNQPYANINEILSASGSDNAPGSSLPHNESLPQDLPFFENTEIKTEVLEYMETEYTEFPEHVLENEALCRICTNPGKDLKHIHSINDDKISYYDKLIQCIPEMVCSKLSAPQYICKKCCSILKQVYEFRQLCLRSLKILDLSCQLKNQKRKATTKTSAVFKNICHPESFTIIPNTTQDLQDYNQLELSYNPVERMVDIRKTQPTEKSTDRITQDKYNRLNSLQLSTNSTELVRIKNEIIDNVKEYTSYEKDDTEDEKVHQFDTESENIDINDDFKHFLIIDKNGMGTIKNEPISHRCIESPSETRKIQELVESESNLRYQEFVPNELKKHVKDKQTEDPSKPTVVSNNPKDSHTTKSKTTDSCIELTSKSTETSAMSQLDPLEHANLGNNSCKICFRMYKSKYRLLQHIIKHLEKQNMCEQFEKLFRRPDYRARLNQSHLKGSFRLHERILQEQKNKNVRTTEL